MDYLTSICIHHLAGSMAGFLSYSLAFLSLVAGILLVIGIFKSGKYIRRAIRSDQLVSATLDYNSQTILFRDKISFRPVPIKVYDDDQPRAFTAGFLKPRIYVSSYVMNSMDEVKRDIIIHHEINHVRKHDPLKNLIINTFRELLWFIPVGGMIAGYIKLRSELDCDNYATHIAHRKSDIAKILVQLAEQHFPSNESTSVQSFDDLLEKRVKYHLGFKSRPAYSQYVKSILASIFVITILTLTMASALSRDYNPLLINQTLASIAQSCSLDEKAHSEIEIFGITCPHCSSENPALNREICDH